MFLIISKLNLPSVVKKYAESIDLTSVFPLLGQDANQIIISFFLNNKEKIPNKDFVYKKNIRNEKIKKIDLHGYTIEEANKAVEQFIQECFYEDVTKIIVITGKGLRSKNIENPYLSKDLSILKYSVPEFIENNKSLSQFIIETTDAKIEDGGSGAFYIYLKNKNKFKE